MSEEYTPTTEEVRQHWGIAVDLDRRDSRLAEFDRWLAEVERAAAEKAWSEGFEKCATWWEIHHWERSRAASDNPYRRGGSDD